MALRMGKRKRPSREKKILMERTKISGKVFDDQTLLVLYYLLNNRVFDSLDFPISQGKESVVFRATKGKTFLAVKIFKYETSSFKRMAEYVEGDPRFKMPSQRRKAVQLWARKEFANLKLCGKAGILAPEPVAHRGNVVVMEFLGEKGIPCQLLKDVELEDPERTYREVIESARKLYSSGLVHADLSEYNIIYCNEKPFFIDLGQAVLKSHPHAEEFLLKDVENLVKYFSKLGVKTSLEEALKFVKGD